MIPAETRYKTHNSELLVIVEAFKIWSHYLEGCKHKVLVLTDHNNLWQFMETKNFSSCQVRGTQKLFCYYFQINYCQGKVNKAADALSCFPKRSGNEEAKLQAKNIQTFHCLQFLLTSASLSDLSILASSNLSPLHQVLICITYALV